MTFSIELHHRFIEQAAWTQQAQRLLFQSAGFQSESKVLEVGCGTGAFLSSLASISKADYFGIDIQLDLLSFAHDENSSFPLTCADGLLLPFDEGTFDGVVCHYLLLWINNVEGVLAEMRRVTRSGGIIAALAEPDYGSRIDYPAEFELLGKKQRESLLHQGANPDIGRQLGELLSKSGCQKVASGILGSFRVEPPSDAEIINELDLLRSDLKAEINNASLQALLSREYISQNNNSRVQFIPTFFGWGTNP